MKGLIEVPSVDCHATDPQRVVAALIGAGGEPVK
jgi:hypothetical protein